MRASQPFGRSAIFLDSQMIQACVMMFEEGNTSPPREASPRDELRPCDNALFRFQVPFTMNGQLYEHPLAELIHEIAAAGLSGSLRLARERVKLAIYLEEGSIVYATSNLRAHRLSECMRRWNIPAVQGLAKSCENMSDMELGLELVAKGDLSRDEFEELLARQAIEVLRPALLWMDGGWEFDARVRLTVEIRARVEVGELLMECARRIPQEFIAARFKSEEEKLSPASLEANVLNLQPVEG